MLDKLDFSTECFEVKQLIRSYVMQRTVPTLIPPPLSSSPPELWPLCGVYLVYSVIDCKNNKCRINNSSSWYAFCNASMRLQIISIKKTLYYTIQYKLKLKLKVRILEKVCLNFCFKNV